jgi:hypothetical protein
VTALLYSIFPPEIVFSESGPTEALPQGMRGSSSLPETQERLVEITVDGVRLLAARSASGHARVVRLLSTDPADYLDGRFSPGQEIKM